MLDPRYVHELYVSALGDDNNTALPSFDHTIQDIERVSRHLGHEASGIVVRPGQYHLLEYCSQRIWQVSPGKYVAGPKPGRLLSKTWVAHKHVPEAHLLNHCGGVMQGFKNVSWVPVFRAVYDRWNQLYGKGGKRHFDDTNPYKMTWVDCEEVDAELLRDQFTLIYGFDPIPLESSIAKLEFNMGDSYSSLEIDQMLQVDSISYVGDMDDHTSWRHFL